MHTRLKFNKIAMIDYKLVLIPAVVIFGLIFGLTLMQKYSENPAPISKPQAETNSRVNAGIRQIQESSQGILFGAQYKDLNETAVKGVEPEKSLGRLKNYISGLEERGTFFKEKIELLNKLLEAKEREVSQVTEINLKLKEDLNKAAQAQQESKTDLQTRLDNLNAQFTAKETEVSNLNNLKLNLENQVNDLNNKLSVLSTTYSALESQFNQLKTDKSVLEAQLDKVRQDLKQQTVINETLNKDVVELKDALSDKDKERHGLAQELEQTLATKKKLEFELNELKIIRIDQENKLLGLNEQVKGLQKVYEDGENSVSQMSALISKKDLDIAAIQNDLSKMQDNFYKVSSEKEALFLSLKEKEKSIGGLETALSNTDSRIAQLQKELRLEQERQMETQKKLDQAKLINNALKNRLKNIYMEIEFMRVNKKR